MRCNKDTLIEKILKLKKDRQAIILAHNYQIGEVQDIADFVGDSFELSKKATETDANVIVFCGVDFMAETAAILNSEKIVLHPEPLAKCPMAAMIDPERLRAEKEKHPGALVVAYVNTSAAIKAESDVCCTSANAVKVVESVDAEKILFIPDQYLGNYVSLKTKKKLYLYPGFCPTHVRIQLELIKDLKKKYPKAKVVIHPECRPEVIKIADEVLSTGGLCRYARREDVEEIIVGTEIGIIHRLQKENPNKRFIAASENAICPNMKLITLEKILQCLEDMHPQVKIEDKILDRARESLIKMLEIQ